MKLGGGKVITFRPEARGCDAPTQVLKGAILVNKVEVFLRDLKTEELCPKKVHIFDGPHPLPINPGYRPDNIPITIFVCFQAFRGEGVEAQT